MDKDNLQTQQEFNFRVRQWADVVEAESQAALSVATSGTGALGASILTKLGNTSKYPINRIAFTFAHYGVFVHYGVGRGYVREGGTVQRGFTTRGISMKELKSQPIYQKYGGRQIRRMKFVNSGGINRKPVDWIDRNIDRNIIALANMAGEFYGDNATRVVLKDFDKIKIDK